LSFSKLKKYNPKNSSITPLNKEPFVSVVVPVYNDASRISKCIESLLNQSYPCEKYEILVIDNGSTDGTPNVVLNYDVKLLFENTIQSSYAARNAGIKNVRGEVIAFTDADCIPAPDWIAKGVANLLRVPDCGLVAGRINPVFKDPKTPTAVEIYESILHFQQERYLKRDKYGATANVFTYKRVFEKVGVFNDKLKSGGDNEWGRRVFASGYKQVYADDASVDHPTRYSLDQLHRRISRLAGGKYDQHRKNRFFILRYAIKSMKLLSVSFVKTIFSLMPGQNLNGLKKKLQFLLICVYVEFIRNSERIRLAAGGGAKRE